MYYEEKVINGILHCRYAPDDEWVAVTPKNMTLKIERLTQELADVVRRLKESEAHPWKDALEATLIKVGKQLEEAEAREAVMVEALGYAIERLKAHEEPEENADLEKALSFASPRAKQILAVVEAASKTHGHHCQWGVCKCNICEAVSALK